MDITLAGIVLTLAVIAARVILSHRDFKDQEYIISSTGIPLTKTQRETRTIRSPNAQTR